MEHQKVTTKFKNYITNNNLICGICDAKRLDYLDNSDISAPFVSYGKEERINPCLTMAEAKSIIVIGVGYRKKTCFINDNIPRGKFSINAIGLDYHKVVGKHLDNIVQILKEYSAISENLAFVDTGPLLEREFAKKAGLGWQGKNMSIISEKFGSFFNIGYIITDIKLPVSDSSYNNLCGDCEACITSCPTNTLNNNKELNNFGKCISYLTQTKDLLEDKQMEQMNNSLYGCDICQNVCKFNKDKYLDEVITNIDEVKPTIENILSLTNKTFMDKYGNTAIAWRGRNIIQRNAIIALSNNKNKFSLNGYNNININIKNALDYLKKRL